MRFALLCVGVVVAAFNNVDALNEADKIKLYAAMVPTIKECSTKFGVSQETIENAKQTKNADNLDQCFIACVFKKGGVINDAGQFDIGKTEELISQYISESDVQAKAKEAIGKCASVNDQTVSDSDGCERAKLLMDCLIPLKKEFEDSR